MKKLLVYMKGYKKQCVLAPLFKMLEAGFELFIPLVVASIIDTGIANSDTSYIVWCCVIMVVLGAIGLSCTLFAQYFSAYCAVGFVSAIKHGLFKHISSLSYKEIDTLGTSTMITRMTSDVNQVQTGVNLTLRLFMRSPVIVFGAMIMAFIVDVKASLIFVITIPLLALVVFGIILSTIPLYKKVQAKLDKVMNTSRENLNGARVIRAFGLEESERKKFRSQTDELNLAQKFVGKISAIMNPATYAIVNLSIAILIWQGAIQVDYGDLTQGQVIALYNYMSQILIELIKLANLIVTITKAVASGNRIEAVFDVKPSQSSGTIKERLDSPYAIEFKNVCLRYEGSPEYTLENISFTAKRGEKIGIIGGTGSGKSSLVNMIGRFYDAEKGHVLYNGQNVENYDLEFLRDEIGIVPQKAILFRGTVRDNLKWGNKNATDEELLSSIKSAQATDVLLSKSEGLDFVIEEGGKNLSGGQRQRYTIARALVKRSPILMLDDSASALDYATDASLRQAIWNLDFKPTTFIVSQRTASIMGCDKIIVLDDGKIVGIGTHKELLDNCLVYSEIYNSQFKEEE